MILFNKKGGDASMMLFNWWGKNTQAPIPLAKAIDILGRDRVVSWIQSGHIWKQIAGDVMVPYFPATLKKAAQQNKKYSKQYYLVCLYNVSMFAMNSVAVRGFTSLEQDVILTSKHHSSQPLYVLVDFYPRCKGWSFDEGERYLRRHTDLVRMRTHRLAEALHVVYKVHGTEFLTDMVHVGEVKPIFDQRPELEYPRRLGNCKNGVPTLMCLPLSVKTRTKSSCMIVMHKPDSD